jgi:hypothetical protein
MSSSAKGWLHVAHRLSDICMCVTHNKSRQHGSLT